MRKCVLELFCCCTSCFRSTTAENQRNRYFTSSPKSESVPSTLLSETVNQAVTCTHSSGQHRNKQREKTKQLVDYEQSNVELRSPYQEAVDKISMPCGSIDDVTSDQLDISLLSSCGFIDLEEEWENTKVMNYNEENRSITDHNDLLASNPDDDNYGVDVSGTLNETLYISKTFQSTTRDHSSLESTCTHGIVGNVHDIKSNVVVEDDVIPCSLGTEDAINSLSECTAASPVGVIRDMPPCNTVNCSNLTDSKMPRHGPVVEKVPRNLDNEEDCSSVIDCELPQPGVVIQDMPHCDTEQNLSCLSDCESLSSALDIENVTTCCPGVDEVNREVIIDIESSCNIRDDFIHCHNCEPPCPQVSIDDSRSCSLGVMEDVIRESLHPGIDIKGLPPCTPAIEEVINSCNECEPETRPSLQANQLGEVQAETNLTTLSKPNESTISKSNIQQDIDESSQLLNSASMDSSILVTRVNEPKVSVAESTCSQTEPTVVTNGKQNPKRIRVQKSSLAVATLVDRRENPKIVSQQRLTEGAAQVKIDEQGCFKVSTCCKIYKLESAVVSCKSNTNIGEINASSQVLSSQSVLLKLKHKSLEKTSEPERPIVYEKSTRILKASKQLDIDEFLHGSRNSRLADVAVSSFQLENINDCGTSFTNPAIKETARINSRQFTNNSHQDKANVTRSTDRKGSSKTIFDKDSVNHNNVSLNNNQCQGMEDELAAVGHVVRRTSSCPLSKIFSTNYYNEQERVRASVGGKTRLSASEMLHNVSETASRTTNQLDRNGLDTIYYASIKNSQLNDSLPHSIKSCKVNTSECNYSVNSKSSKAAFNSIDKPLSKKKSEPDTVPVPIDPCQGADLAEVPSPSGSTIRRHELASQNMLASQTIVSGEASQAVLESQNDDAPTSKVSEPRNKLVFTKSNVVFCKIPENDGAPSQSQGIVILTQTNESSEEIVSENIQTSASLAKIAGMLSIPRQRAKVSETSESLVGRKSVGKSRKASTKQFDLDEFLESSSLNVPAAAKSKDSSTADQAGPTKRVKCSISMCHNTRTTKEKPCSGYPLTVETVGTDHVLHEQTAGIVISTKDNLVTVGAAICEQKSKPSHQSVSDDSKKTRRHARHILKVKSSIAVVQHKNT